jgi:hypothetical protein
MKGKVVYEIFFRKPLCQSTYRCGNIFIANDVWAIEQVGTQRKSSIIKLITNPSFVRVGVMFRYIGEWDNH